MDNNKMRQLLEKYGYDPEMWFLVREYVDRIYFMSKDYNLSSNETKMIVLPKEGVESDG